MQSPDEPLAHRAKIRERFRPFGEYYDLEWMPSDAPSGTAAEERAGSADADNGESSSC